MARYTGLNAIPEVREVLWRLVCLIYQRSSVCAIPYIRDDMKGCARPELLPQRQLSGAISTRYVGAIWQDTHEAKVLY